MDAAQIRKRPGIHFAKDRLKTKYNNAAMPK